MSALTLHLNSLQADKAVEGSSKSNGLPGYAEIMRRGYCRDQTGARDGDLPESMRTASVE